MDSSSIKPGDTVTRKSGDAVADRYEVIAAHAHQLWLKPEGGASALSYLARDFEKVEPFFEVGRTYRRRFHVVETFECLVVEPEEGGSRAAFGRYRKGAEPMRCTTLRYFKGWSEG